jgi:hypothetical protein
MADDLYEDESPPVVEPTHEAEQTSETDDADQHPLIALLHRHFGEDDKMWDFFHELHAMMQANPGTDYWRGG